MVSLQVILSWHSSAGFFENIITSVWKKNNYGIYVKENKKWMNRNFIYKKKENAKKDLKKSRKYDMFLVT